MTTPEARLAAALALQVQSGYTEIIENYRQDDEYTGAGIIPPDVFAARILAADPQLAADIALGAAIRDENNPLLAQATTLAEYDVLIRGERLHEAVRKHLRAALLAKAGPE